MGADKARAARYEYVHGIFSCVCSIARGVAQISTMDKSKSSAKTVPIALACRGPRFWNQSVPDRTPIDRAHAGIVPFQM
jgi:hypothetical protein